MNKIIELDTSYEFCFLEEKINIEHPLCNYYTKLDDMSINLYISLKWIKWGYFFMTSISSNLDILKQEYKINEIISKGIHVLKEENEEKKEIIIDDIKIGSENEFEHILEHQYNCKILGKIFNENTKIHLKLKLNLREYLIITNVLYPTLIRWEK